MNLQAAVALIVGALFIGTGVLVALAALELWSEDR